MTIDKRETARLMGLFNNYGDMSSALGPGGKSMTDNIYKQPESAVYTVKCPHEDWAIEIADKVPEEVVFLLARSNLQAHQLIKAAIPIRDPKEYRLITECEACGTTFYRQLTQRVTSYKSDCLSIDMLLIMAMGRAELVEFESEELRQQYWSHLKSCELCKATYEMIANLRSQD